MKKVWDFLLLVVSGLLVFVAIIAVALWLSQDDEPPATADSRGDSTEKVVPAHATVPSASTTVPESPATVPETPGATPAAVQHHESMAGAPASAPADSLSRHEETREASPEGTDQGASGLSVALVSAAPSTAPTSAAQSSAPPPMSERGPAEQQLIERYEAMAARERALRQAEDRMAKAHERLVVWFSTNRKAVLEDLAYLEEKGRYQELHDRAGLFESLNDSEVQRYRQKAAENLQQVVSGNATVAGTGTAVANRGEDDAGRAGTMPGTAGRNDRKPPVEDAVSLARADMATAVAKGKARIREQLKGLKRWPCVGPTQGAMTWYHDSEGVRCSTGTGFFLLLGMQDGQKPVLMLRVQYDGPNALPIRSFEVEIIWTPEEVPAGIGAESGEQGNVVWWAKPVGKREAKLVLDIIDRSRSKLRIGGQKGMIEREISAQERNSLRRTLTLYEAALSSYEEEQRLANASAVGTGVAD
ncbi:hypothetical protein V7R83_05605 [Lautropia mirabilis ATCC 51599]|nr:hypothetical protein [Lautropia mirabilis]